MNFCQLSRQPGYLASTFVDFQRGWETLRQLPSTFRTARRPSMNFPCSVRPCISFQQLPFGQKPSVNFSQQCMLGDLPQTSIKFPCSRDTFRQIPSTFRAARRPSVNFRQVFVLLDDLPSTSVKFLFSQKIIREISVWPGDFSSNSSNFPCGRETSRQLPSNFSAAGRPSVNFRQLSLRPDDLSTFRAAGRPSINFRAAWRFNVNRL